MFEIPMKKKFRLCYPPVSVRLDKELSDARDELGSIGVEVPEVMRELFRANLPDILRRAREKVDREKKSS
jgi:hypothetical protein